MTVLVIELNSFHLELLPMYQPLLPHLCGPEIRIRYLVIPSLLDRAQAIVGDRAEKANPRWLKYSLPSKTLRARYYRRRIQRLVDRLQPAAVVFNTVEPVAYFSVFRHVRHPVKIGIVHNPKREGIDYSPRRSGELIFCLHDYNYHLLRKDTPVDGYLSPFFRYREADSARRPDGRLEIAVQGVISFNRRDYPFLVALCERLAQRAPRKEFVFNILGDVRLRDGPQLGSNGPGAGPRRPIPVSSRAVGSPVF